MSAIKSEKKVQAAIAVREAFHKLQFARSELMADHGEDEEKVPEPWSEILSLAEEAGDVWTALETEIADEIAEHDRLEALKTAN